MSVGHVHTISTFNPLVQILGEVAIEAATLWNVLKFILMLWPLWSIWTDMRSYLNVVCPLAPSASTSTSTNHPQSGTDDAAQRVYILLTSILLISCTVQGASIGLRQDETGCGLIPSQVYEGLQGRQDSCWLPKASVSSKPLWYAWYLPKFRCSLFVQVVFTLIPSVVFFRLLNVDSLLATLEIFVLEMDLDLIIKYIAGILVSTFGADGSNDPHLFIPALEIGQVAERITAFYILVVGEILIVVSYIATECEIGDAPWV